MRTDAHVFLLALGSLGSLHAAAGVPHARAQIGLVPHFHPSVDGAGTVRIAIEGAGGALRLRTTQCGSRPETARPIALPRPDGGHGIELLRGECRERLVGAGASVEQSWHYDRAPQGAIVVRIATDGLRPARTSADGIAFVNAAANVAITYGHGTWVDAAGVRTPVPAELVDGEIQLRVPNSVVRASVFPAVLDPVISAAFTIDASSGLTGPALKARRAAFGGGVWMTGWTDDRAADAVGAAIINSGDIALARFDATGAPLDPLAIWIAHSVASETIQDIASDGTGFLVVWARQIRGGDLEVRASRVDASGRVLDFDGFLVGSAGSGVASANARVAFDGSNYIVAWTYGPRRLAIAYVSTDGRALVPTIDAAPFVSGASAHDVACTEGTCFVVYRSADDALLLRRLRGAEFLDASPIAVETAPGPVGVPRIVATPRHALIAWATDSGAVYRRFGLDGRPLDAAELPLVGGTLGVDGIASDGDGSLVVVSGTIGAPRVIRGVRIASDGTVDATLVNIADTDVPADVAFGDDQYLTVTDAQPSVQPVSRDGVLGRAWQLPTARAAQRRPSVAFDGRNFLVAWAENLEIRGTRIDPNGVALDNPPLAIGSGAVSTSSPSVTFADGTYTVVWRTLDDIDRSGIDTRQVSVGGAMGAVRRLSSTIRASAPVAAPMSTGVRVAWLSNAATSTVQTIRLDTTGAPLDATPASFTGLREPQVACGAGQCLIIWPATATNLMGARVTDAGVVLDGAGRLLLTHPASTNREVAVSFDGTNFLTVWSDDRSGNPDVFGARFSPALTLLDATPFVIGGGASEQVEPFAFFDGIDHAIIWETHAAFAQTDLDAARIAVSGVVRDATPLVISHDPVVDEAEVAAAAGAGRALLVYEQYVDDPFLTIRVRGRFYDPSRPALACISDSECGSGHCVDAVCCDRPCGGGALDDCQACAVSAGAAADGTCGPVSRGTVCRATAGPCDATESCDGLDVACPADLVAVNGTGCRASRGPCDAPEACDGLRVTCPDDRPQSALSSCGLPQGNCDETEMCDGVSGSCPVDRLMSAGIVCRVAVDVCDVDETCSGLEPSCPSDGARADGTPCDDGLVCNGSERCVAGACRPGAGLMCDDHDDCTADTCAETAGCESVPIPDCCTSDAECRDGDPCSTDRCVANRCAFELIPDCPMDAGTFDAGVADVDAASDDSGATDAGRVPEDGAMRDAARAPDAARDAGAGRPSDGASGCGCSVPESPPKDPTGLILAAAVSLTVLSRRRARVRA